MERSFTRSAWMMLPAWLALVLAVVPVVAATVHVSPDGDDGAPGIEAEPVQTLRKALELVRGSEDASEIVIHE
ncbi:MAG TPA: hypothetical protein QGH10_19475, partial [Armatimonadota bacterium]|nr:hypothetical protein [Armatimonadota bacterium]